MSESAATYVSILNFNEKSDPSEQANQSDERSMDLPTAFSLARFIPLLEERIHVMNPFTRTFLVSWLTLLDTIPDLELVHYLPDFLGGVFKFLGDPNRDVYVATQGLLERFLSEIKKVAKIKRDIDELRKNAAEDKARKSTDSQADSAISDNASDDNAVESNSASEEDLPNDGDWIPGQDVQVDHAKIFDILLKFVDVSSTRDTAPLLRIEGLSKQKEEEISIVALRWIDNYFEISPEDILQFVPRLLSQVLPALSAQSDQVRTTAARVNRSLMDYIVTMQDETFRAQTPPSRSVPDQAGDSKSVSTERRTGRADVTSPEPSQTETPIERSKSPAGLTPRSSAAPSPTPVSDLDYAASVHELTLQFVNEHEATRVAALSWLLMLHKKAPKKVLAFNDGTFPALLKTLSDPSESVVTRDLQLLSQISRNSEDGYFTSFMVNLLQLFSTDRKLLEIRGNLIIRQLCINLLPERIYRTLADCLEKDEDIEFASIMVQNLNNNLITAPELAELRKRLRNLESSRDGQQFFIALFKAWCYNAVATFSLCLLAQAYEQAYGLLQIFAELEMTVNMLIQIDKLVQLLESPVFTYLRLQLLEPDRYPYLYKCLYGLLMLLPQSSAFAALKNRLNSVSAIGLLHTPASYSFPTSTPTTQRGSIAAGMSIPLSSALPTTSSTLCSSLAAPGNLSTSSTSTVPTMPGRLGRAVRDNSTTAAAQAAAAAAANDVKWPELIDKFRSTQQRARRRNQLLAVRERSGDVAGMGGPATRGLFERDFISDDVEGEERRRRGGEFDGSGGGVGTPYRAGGGIGRGMAGTAIPFGASGAGKGAGPTPGRPGSGLGLNRPLSGSGFVSASAVGVLRPLETGGSGAGAGGSAGVSGTGASAGSTQTQTQTQQQSGHRSRHSLAGGFGKFVRGHGIGGGSGGGGGGGSGSGASVGATAGAAGGQSGSGQSATGSGVKRDGSAGAGGKR